jgi:hypothetical protein
MVRRRPKFRFIEAAEIAGEVTPSGGKKVGLPIPLTAVD